MARFGHAIWAHESKPFAAGGNVVVSLADVPPQTELLGVLVRMKFDVAQAAGAPAILGDNLYRLLAFVAIDGIPGVTPTIQATGKLLNLLQWHMRGKQLIQPADVPAAGAGNYSRVLDIWVPFEDYQSANPGDCACPAELFRNSPLRLNFADPQVIYNVNTTVINATVRVLSFYRPWSPGSLPAIPFIKYEDWNQQSITLGGDKAYTHLFAYSETTDMTDANFATFSIYADGRAIKPLLQTGELVAEYNLYRAEGALQQNRGVTYPAAVATPGSIINDEPTAPGVGGTQGLTVPWIPLMTPPDNYKLTQVVHPDQQLRLDFTGVATTIRLAYRTITESNRSAIMQMANLLGITDADKRVITTRNMKRGGPVSARQALILPKRLQLNSGEILAKGGETGIQS